MLTNSTLTLPPIEDALHTAQVIGGVLVPDHFIPAWEVDEARDSHRLYADLQGRLYVLRSIAWLEAADLAIRSANKQQA